ncbi:hypothetical protein D4A92_19625 [Rhizobium rosettiformans]|uniref:Uncharacterized protein n=2 Tax=Rhizobium TaxID=379 RepID=A0ABX7EZI7_9HYPH|nr:hypothetical protein [Rhizobium rosettiformans]QRF53497.1 hypothetical protein D4A92_19625 [Rhizobium rosettiformans]
MPVTTKGVVCPAGQWTPIATSVVNFLASLRSPGVAYIKTGASTPGTAPNPSGTGNALDFITVKSGQPISLSVGEFSPINVYAYPSGEGALTFEVISE